MIGKFREGKIQESQCDNSELFVTSKYFADKLICSSFTCFRMCPVGILGNRYDNDGILITDFFIIQYIVEILVGQRYPSHWITQPTPCEINLSLAIIIFIKPDI